jgi:hypothetical protein
MNYFAIAVLVGWIPCVMFIFTVVPPKKAVCYLYVFAWLFLPEGGFALPGIPDYTKMSATAVGILLSAVLFDSGKLLSLRPRWFDLPVLAFCFGPAISALTNGLTVWDGLAMTMESLIAWGLPYLVGRAYLTDLEAYEELAKAMILGGLLYCPLCLFEIRMSPQLASKIYGLGLGFEGERYGGYRPRVFLFTGLATGAWMMNSTLMAFVLWSSKTIKSIRGVPFGLLTLGMFGTTVLVKSTGAIILLITGIGVFSVARKTNKSLFVWLLIAITPVYCITRTLNLWSGQEIVEFTKVNISAERAESFQYRLDMERLLADRAMERPIFGWSGYNRFQVSDTHGKVLTVPDGFWIIVLGQQGLVGLTSILAMFLLPLARTVIQYPPSTWRNPRVTPVVGVGIALVLMMIDCLSNGMLMPIYPFAIGGLIGFHKVLTSDGWAEPLAEAHALADEGRLDEAVHEYAHAIELASRGDDPGRWEVLAEAHDGLGRAALALGRPFDAIEAFRETLALRDEFAAGTDDVGRFRDLAFARDALARALVEADEVEAAIEERRIGLDLWDALAIAHPGDDNIKAARADALNDLAWLLATASGVSARDPAYALALAEEAARVAPDHPASWNTLGVVRYRAGDWLGAIEALERSTSMGTEPGGSAFDHYFLAMACCQLGQPDQASLWIERGEDWTARHRPGHTDLIRFRDEATSLVDAAGRLGHV